MARKRNNASKPSNDRFEKEGKDTKDFKAGRSKNRRNSRSRKDDTFKKSAPTNDPAWYGTSPELLKDAASIPFSWSVGMNFNTTHDFDINHDLSFGLMSMEVSPTIGLSQDERSAVNVASSAIYSFIRHANSGHANYDAPDMMMYLLAMSNVYSYVTWCQRLLGSVSLYDQRNRYLPKVLFEANNVDFADFRDNIANFRFWLNLFVTKVASLAVPATMPIFNRLAFLYSNVYIDGPTIKDQMYMLTPYKNMWYKFEISSVTNMGRLVLYDQDDGTPWSVQQIMKYGEDLFDAIWQQEDFGIMSGDILKAYGSSIIKLLPIPVDFTVVPVYDPLFLHQFKNARLVRNMQPGPISQTEHGLIKHRCYIDDEAEESLVAAFTRVLLSANKVLTSDFDHPGPDVIVESTRLIPTHMGTGSNVGWIHTGTEIPKLLRVFWYTSEGELVDTILTDYDQNLNDKSGFLSYGDGTSRTSIFQNYAQVAEFTKAFKYAPEIMCGLVDLSGETFDPDEVFKSEVYRVWDIDNYAILSPDDLVKMHDSALLSLFAVPAIAKIS